jgi:DNA-directed RNA polymerase I, II, and III subunit RPABC3
LYARSKNYDMDMTLDYNTELFPLAEGQHFAMALASSLARDGGAAAGVDGAGAEDKDKDVWRPDGKGRKGLEEDYDYVMYGKVSWIFMAGVSVINGGCMVQVYKFDGGTAEIV